MSDTPDLTQSLTATLIDPQARIDALTQELKKRDTRILFLQDALATARTFDERLDEVMRELYSRAKGEPCPDEADVTEMFERVVDLVTDDDDEVWTPEREFSVTIKYEVRVTGTVIAKTLAEAKERVEEDLPEFRVQDDGALSNADIEEADVEYVEVE